MNSFIWKASLNVFNSLTPPKTPDEYSEKAVKSKKNKVYLFLSLTGVDILENKTKVSDITGKKRRFAPWIHLNWPQPFHSFCCTPAPCRPSPSVPSSPLLLKSLVLWPNIMQRTPTTATCSKARSLWVCLSLSRQIPHHHKVSAC